MTWRDGFSAQGSFKGATFYVREAELEVGRRVQVHEYPLREKPYAEDLGRKARKIQFEAYCVGPNYHVDRDALIARIEESGGGALVHPYHGTLTVTVTSFRVRESTREGGYAAITIQCVEAGEKAFPAAIASTQQAVVYVAEQTIVQAEEVFAEDFSITDAAGAVDDFLDEVDAALAGVANEIGSIAGPLADIIRAPAELAAAIAGAVTNIESIATEPLRALNIYRRLFGAGTDTAGTNASPRANQAAKNTQALNELVRTTALASACKSSASLELSPAKQDDAPFTHTSLFALRDSLLDALDDRQQVIGSVTGEPINDDLYSRLADLRAAVMRDLSTRGKRLPTVVTFMLGATLPALVVAHQRYGIATRDAELVNLNNIRHPGFVPGGQLLEALSE